MFESISECSYQGFVHQKNAYSSMLACAPINHWVNCFWQLDVEPGDYIYRSVPDNCIDWIVNLHNIQDNFVVAPFSSAIEFPIEGPASYFGIRFKILAFQGFIAKPVGEWQILGSNIEASEIIGASIVEQLSQSLISTRTLSERCSVASGILLNHLSPPSIDSRLERFVRCALHSNQMDINSFGVSSRQLRRLSHLYLGLSIKDFLKVIRFQKTLHLINTHGAHHAWLDHYYDQAHFIREFKSLAGASPKKFLRMSVLYNK